ncbi:hypothetical protein ASAP_2325 [Asaia bogorensis]|uniref:Uncharacterized protein n=1 Tax=Asaia bogorensis TaxID=91915 RepID=A0A060QHE0_9PROT|nr:hypothetical protein ASAP_2325 [Asaia bogorensis]
MGALNRHFAATGQLRASRLRRERPAQDQAECSEHHDP